jgi:cyanophycin synthetase
MVPVVGDVGAAGRGRRHGRRGGKPGPGARGGGADGARLGTGDRRDDDIREFAQIIADNFDRIVIRRGNYLRGRTEEELFTLLQEGIARSENKPQVRVIPEGREAIHHAIKQARKGELVVTLADKVPDDIRYVQEIRDQILEAEQERAAVTAAQ